MQQPNFPPPGQQDPITQTDYPLPAGDNKKPQNSNTQPGQTMPQQNYVQTMPQQNYVQTMPQQNYNMPQQNYGQAMPQQNYQYQQPQMVQPQYQQPQMGPPMPPQQFYQQQGQFYQQPVQQMPLQQFPVMTPPMAMPILPLQPWTTGLFDCANDMENTIITFFCPCITFGQIADIVDRGMTTCSSAGIIYLLILSCTGLQWIYSWMYRSRLRAQYSLPEDPFHDCLVHFFCEYCALCQEYRELKNRGFNMELGYVGNMQLQAQMDAIRVAPPVQGMTR